MSLEHSVKVTCVQSFVRKARQGSRRRGAVPPMFHFNSFLHFALLSPLRVVNAAAAAAAAKRRLSIEFAALKAPFTAPPLHLMGRVPKLQLIPALIDQDKIHVEFHKVDLT